MTAIQGMENTPPFIIENTDRHNAFLSYMSTIGKTKSRAKRGVRVKIKIFGNPVLVKGSQSQSAML